MSHKKNMDELFTSKFESRNFEFNEEAWTNMESMLTSDVDNLFKDKLSAREVAYDEKSWLKMEALMDSQTSSKFILKPLYSAAAGLALLVTTGTGLYFSTENTNQVSLAQTHVTEQESNTSKEIFSDTENTNENSTLDPNTTTGEFTSSNNSPVEIGTQPFSTGKTENNTLSNSDDVQETYITEESNSDDLVIPTSESNTVLGNGSNSTEQISSQSNQNNLAFVNPSNETESSIDNTEIIEIEEILTMPELLSEQSIMMKPLEEEEEDIQLVFLDSFQLPKQKRHYFGLMFGANLSQEFESQTKNQSSFSPKMFGGLNYKYIAGRKLALNANLLYQSRGDINTEKMHYSTNYDFGFVKDTSIVRANQLHYIELPIYADYLINGKHTLLAGLSTSYLVESSSDVHSKSTNNFTSSESNSKEFGHNDGFERIDAAAIIGYEYLIQPNLNVGLRMNYGFLDVTKNDYFHNNIDNNNLQFRFYLNYKLFSL